MALREVVAAGEREKSLIAIRDHLAATLQEAAPQYVAALAKQLGDVIREIHTLNPPKVASTIDDLAAARASRRKKAAASKRSAAKRQRGPRGS